MSKRYNQRTRRVPSTDKMKMFKKDCRNRTDESRGSY